MAGHLIYHWKHGWIPLTHAAALSKAHGSPHLADKYVPGASAHHTSAVTHGRSAREIHATLTPHTHANGAGKSKMPNRFKVEKSKHLPEGAANSHHVVDTHAGKVARENTGKLAYYPSSAKAHEFANELNAAHHQGLAPSPAEMDAAGARHIEEVVDKPRAEAAKRSLENAAKIRPGAGALPKGYKVTEDRVQAAPGHDILTGRYSFEDASGRHHYVGGSQTVAARRAQQHAERAASVEQERQAKVATREAAARADEEAHRAIRETKIEHMPPATNEDRRLMLQASGLGTKSLEPQIPTADVQKIAESKSPYISEHSRAEAARLLAERKYAEAKSRLSGQSDPQLAALRGRLDALPPAARAGAEKYINERLGTRSLAGQGKADAAPESGASEKRAQVEHSGDGTLLHLDRNDTEARAAAKAAGFKWSSNLGSWFLPRNWSEPTRRQKIAQLQGALGHDNVHLEDAGRGVTTTAAEREAEARARAADRATHMDAKAQRLATEADVRFGRAKAIGDMIPFGQPILVGHHSEGRHRRDLAKIDTNMRKGMEAHSEAQAAAAAAERARAATAGDSPLARQRRIDRKEAEVRKIDRALKDHELAQKLSATGRDPRRFGVYPSDPSHVEQMQANRAQLVDEIAHDKAQIAASGHQTIDRANVSAGDVIHYRGRAHVVSKVNQTTVSVPTGYSWDDKVPVNQITRHVKMADLSEASLRSAFTLAKSNPKLRATLLRELNRRGISAADL